MQALIASCSIADACAYAEISDATYYKWQERAREHKAAGKKSEYTEFFEEIARTRARGCVILSPVSVSSLKAADRPEGARPRSL